MSTFASIPDRENSKKILASWFNLLKTAGVTVETAIATLSAAVQPINKGGTGQTTRAAALGALLPTQSGGTAGYNLTSTGTAGSESWTQSSATTPAGAILMFAGSSAPSGFLLCDGSAVSRSTYATLFAAIATVYGAGDGSTTFNLPDTRGLFVRGNGAQTLSGLTYTGSLGTRQVDTTKKNGLALSDPGHYHTMPTTALSLTGGSNRTPNNTANAAAVPTDVATTNISLGAGDAETRPANISFNYIIKT